jgi:hypothetical protein
MPDFFCSKHLRLKLIGPLGGNKDPTVTRFLYYFIAIFFKKKKKKCLGRARHGRDLCSHGDMERGITDSVA